jgi:membrane protease YdiL (CAAX protease family)
MFKKFFYQDIKAVVFVKFFNKAPLLEEWVFRNLILIYLNNDFTKNTYYILVSSLIFSLAHFRNFPKLFKNNNLRDAINMQSNILLYYDFKFFN